jgi:hypothetical protein
MRHMTDAAEAVPVLDGRAAQRFSACIAVTRAVMPFDRREAELALAEMLANGASSGTNVGSGARPASSPVESV